MKQILATLALLLAAPALAQEPALSVEAQLAQCIYDHDPALLQAIRDAASEDEFVAAFRRGAELCDASLDYEYSFGRFFDALNALIGPPNHGDTEEAAQ